MESHSSRTQHFITRQRSRMLREKLWPKHPRTWTEGRGVSASSSPFNQRKGSVIGRWAEFGCQRPERQRSCAINLPPFARPDFAQAPRPGQEIEIPVLANDVD